MDQLGYSNTNIDWNVVGPLLLLMIISIMIALFKKDSLYTQQAIQIGGGFFIMAIILNIIGFIAISDSFTVFAFTIIVIASIRLFWNDTKKLSKKR